jgi:hypothetical protein
MSYVLAKHPERRIKAIGTGFERTELLDQGLDKEMFGVSFIDLFLAVVSQRAVSSRIEKLFLNDGMDGQFFACAANQRCLCIKVRSVGPFERPEQFLDRTMVRRPSSYPSHCSVSVAPDEVRGSNSRA